MNVFELLIFMGVLAGILEVSLISWLVARTVVRKGLSAPLWLQMTLLMGSVFFIMPATWLLANGMYVAAGLLLAACIGCMQYPLHENTEEQILSIGQSR